MDLPKEIQAIDLLYKIYWNQKEFLSFEKFYKAYLKEYGQSIKNFQEKTGMCEKCFYKGLPARIYRTWASIITQIHAGYVAESVLAKTQSQCHASSTIRGGFQAKYKNKILNYQVKKKSLGREVRQEKPKSKTNCRENL